MNCTSSILALLVLLVAPCNAISNDDVIRQGQYIFFAAGCISCHTIDVPLAGGRAIDSPFGTFYSPNITPHQEYGIGYWTLEDLIRAMREGVGPEGQHYYPAFPYPSFTRMTRRDIMVLYNYLLAQAAFPRKNRPHELFSFLSNRALIAHWKGNWFTPGVLKFDPNRSTDWNRGQYLALALGHCSECHTPRDMLGRPLMNKFLAGTRDGPGSSHIPNITPDKEAGIGEWTHEDLESFLTTGRKPDGCYTTGLMMEVLGTNCIRLTKYDQHALAIYLSALPPIHNDLYAKQISSKDSDCYE